MDKLDLDINKYSSNELLDIFNIPNVANSEQITKHMSTYTDNIISDNNLSLSEKDNITFFLHKVVDKLTDSLDKQVNNLQHKMADNSLLDTYSAPSNSLIKGIANNHPVIVDQNAAAGLKAKTYEGRLVQSDHVPPGYINPINIKTIKKTVNVDTRFRTPYYSTKCTDFMFSLPQQFKKVVKMQITSIELPLTIYTINKSFDNTHFHIDDKIVTLPDGNYTANSDMFNSILDSCNNIIDSINDSIHSSTNIHYRINRLNGKSRFTNTSGTMQTINFNTDICNNIDLDTPLPLKLGWLLGFRVGEYQLDSSGSLESESICSIIGPRYIYLCINDFTNAANNNFVAAFTSSVLSPYIIARINYQSLVQNNGFYRFSQDDDFHDSMNRGREYFGPVDIQKLHFQILDEYGRVVDLNGMDWSCALTFDILYD